MNDEDKIDPKAELADAWWDEVRNPQLAEVAEKIESLSREYGLRDIEFDMVIEMVKDSMFTFIDFVGPEDDEEEELP